MYRVFNDENANENVRGNRKDLMPQNASATIAQAQVLMPAPAPASAPAPAPKPAPAPAAGHGATPSSACAPACEDRRITRSRRALRAALIELTEQVGLDGFSASELCACAELNRGTLYNNFGDKDGLLRSLEDEVLSDLARFQAAMRALTIADLVRYRSGRRPMPFLVELFDYLREQGDFLHAVLGPRGDASFGPRLRDAVCTNLIQAILHERYRNDPTPFVQYYMAYYASAYLGVIERWIETGMNESSEEMARIAMRLFFIKPGDAITL